MKSLIMTTKKVLAFSFLLIANISILAHTVLFHHHENPVSVDVCAESYKHCCSDNNKEKQNHSAEHTNKCCVFDNCILNNPFTITDNYKQIKPEFNSFFTVKNIGAFDGITQITKLDGLPFRQKPYLLLFYTEFISQSMGLRAPPVC